MFLGLISIISGITLLYLVHMYGFREGKHEGIQEGRKQVQDELKGRYDGKA